MNQRPKSDSYFSVAEVVLILGISAIPLFITFPYRINIFLSWEGAYRLYLGQMPFRDFGLPMGYMFWVVPALFFKIFGPYLITLIKAQVFLNIISGFAFRSILKSFGVHAGLRLAVVLMYCISFSFLNLWPWYNHTVIIYQVVSLAFLLHYLLGKNQWWWLALSALFTFFSFFTKQDAGALAFLLNLVLLAFAGLNDKKWKPLALYIVAFLTVAAAFILPLPLHSFGYWFNYGQLPHTARFSALEIIGEIFGQSQWIKFYFFMVLLSCLFLYQSPKDVLQQRNTSLFALLTMGILAEAALLQITSYTPPRRKYLLSQFCSRIFVVRNCTTLYNQF